MAYSELDKRLLKRAVQVEARRVLIKQASLPIASLYTPEMTNEGFGQMLIQHAQNIAGYRPGSEQFNRYVAENNLSPDQANYFYSLGRNLVNLAGSPKAHAATGGKFDAANLKNLFTTLEGKALGQQFLSGFIPQEYSDWLDAVPAAWRAAENTPAYQTLQQQTANDQAQMSWYNPKGLIPTSTLTAYRGITDPNQSKLIRDQILGQALMGVGKGLDPNSPLFRQMIASGATGYLENKIDEWAPKDSMLGRGANSVGKFLLGLVSMIPGYESVVNWLANRDFMFGRELRALPSQIQAQGARMLPGGIAPQQPAQLRQPVSPSVDPMEQQINREIARQDTADANVALAGRVNQGPQNTRGGAVVDASGRAVVPRQQGQVNNANNARSTLGMSTGGNTTAARPNTNIPASHNDRNKPWQ